VQRLEKARLAFVLRDFDDAAPDLPQRMGIGAGAAGQAALLGPAACSFVQFRSVDAGVEDLYDIDVRLDRRQNLGAEPLTAGVGVRNIDQAASAACSSSPTITRPGASSLTRNAPSLSL
jgi:hypothetical protein